MVESERHEDQNCRNNAACQILNEIEGFGKMGKILGKSLKLVCIIKMSIQYLIRNLLNHYFYYKKYTFKITELDFQVLNLQEKKHIPILQGPSIKIFAKNPKIVENPFRIFDVLPVGNISLPKM